MDETCKHECDYTCVAINSALIPRKVEGSAGAQFVSQENTPFFDLGTSTRMSITQTGDPGQCPPQWWLMEVFAHDLQADSVVTPNGRQPTPAWSDIVGSPGRGAGDARLIVYAEGDLIRLDVAHGNRFSFFSDMISVELEVPFGAIAIGSGGQGSNNGVKNVPPDLRLHNIAVFVNIHSNVAPLGQRTGQLTQSIVNPGVESLRIPVPDRAIAVEFFATVAGAAAADPMFWESADGVSASNFVRGIIDFPAGLHQTGILKIPGNAAVVNVGSQVRTTTAVWHLEI